MAGGKTRVRSRSAERRRQIRDRVALGVAALLLVVGVVVFSSRGPTGPGADAVGRAARADAAAPTES